ncbi:MAG: hypothetical protein ACTSR8_12995 [Promethearchaeota archaeon]
MKVQIMIHSLFGNGKKLAETLKAEFPEEYSINIADVKDISPDEIAKECPDVLILGGAIRMFRGDPKSKKWLKELNKSLEKSGNKIKYGTGFLTHALPTEKIQRWTGKYLSKVENCSMIEQTYSKLLTAQVETQKGPIFPEEMNKAKGYIQEFINWMG